MMVVALGRTSLGTLFGLSLVVATTSASASFSEHVATLSRAKDWRARTTAATALGRAVDPRARRPLIIALDDPHYAVRAAAIRALTRLGDARATAPIIDRLNDEEPFVRREARRAIETFTLDEIEDDLLDALRHHDAARARMAAAERLAEGDSPEIIAAMVEVSGDRNEVGRFARAHLMSLPDGRAIEVFRRALGHTDYRVQKVAITALAELGDGESAEAIVDKLGSKLPDVTLAAAAALHTLAPHIDRNKYFVLARRADKFRRARALQVVGALGGEDAAVLLLTALDDRDVVIRGAAVSGIAAMSETRAIPKLAKMRKREENARIIQLVKSTLAQLRRARAEQATQAM